MNETEHCQHTYRYLPESVKAALLKAGAQQRVELNELLNELTKFIQKKQRETGKSFVSRTRLNPEAWSHQPIIVFRVVLANPLTGNEILTSVLEEQREISKLAPNLMGKINKLVTQINA